MHVLHAGMVSKFSIQIKSRIAELSFIYWVPLHYQLKIGCIQPLETFVLGSFYGSIKWVGARYIFISNILHL